MATESELDDPNARIKKNYPIDLLRQFVGNSSSESDILPPPSAPELSLGLSLGGRFGIERKTDNSTALILRSSSSIPVQLDEPAEDHSTGTGTGVNITRTCSLPVSAERETEEERMKRKEAQSLKRMEAKRKREEKKKARDQSQSLEEGTVVDVNYNKKVCNVNGVRAASQGSVGSQGSSASAHSEFNFERIKQGLDVSRLGNRSEVKSASAIASSSNKSSTYPSYQAIVKAPGRSSTELDGSSKKIISTTLRSNADEEMERNIMDEMPCVTTRGEGPNGRKIEGFLYRYKKGEDVRIVCVCHGKFLTPAEFVMHAGGGDVENPLRHIVISPTASGFL